jgi:hypothetical protein
MAHDPLKKLRGRNKPDFAKAHARVAALQARLPAGSTAAAVSVHLPEVASVTYDALEAIAGRRVDFSLIVWTEGRFQYISTADRSDVKGALLKLLEGWDAGMPDLPAHEVS